MAAATRPRTPSQDVFNPAPITSHLHGATRGYGSRPNSFVATNSIQPTDFQVRMGPDDTAPMPHQSRFHEELGGRDSVFMDSHLIDDIPHNESEVSFSQTALPARSSTLKKKASLSKKGSLRRGGSKRSSRAGSVRSLKLGEKEKYGVGEDDINSAFYIPIPTKGSPTDVLASRIQAWRKVLKDLIAVFRDIQKSYEQRAKILLSTSNAMSNLQWPSTFLQSDGIGEATNILKSYHKQALLECNKAKDVQYGIVVLLINLRDDLQNKIKEIKNLAGDFKNSVDKEMEGTRKAVRNLHEALGLVDTDPAATSGKGDPFIIKLGVEKQLSKQLIEENYLHRAYLNLENSGRELESIVVGEIQKSFNAYASILKRDADSAYDAIERFREGPLSMPQDREWNTFISQNDQMIDSSIPMRNVRNITYPGIDHPAAAEIRAGMLERKSKYLKSYTPGWYVLSSTHLHEFKSADRIRSQTPVMSLYLPEQKLGSHSQPESSSHKFMLKGRQTGSLHRGHAWVFRAESHDTMLAWYEDIKNLTEKTGEARNAFVRRHVRSVSGISYRAASISSDGVLEEDEADAMPFSSEQMVSTRGVSMDEPRWRAHPGGTFPSQVQLNRTSQIPESISESSSRDPDSSHQAGTNMVDQQHQHQPHGLSDPPETSTNAVQINTRTNSVRSRTSKKSSRLYDEWLANGALPAGLHHRSSLNRKSTTPTPQLSRNGTRIRSIAASTGAPIIVPDITPSPTTNHRRPSAPDPGPDLALSPSSTQPTSLNTKTNPSLTTTTSMGAPSSVAPAGQAPVSNGAGVLGPAFADLRDVDGMAERRGDADDVSAVQRPMLPPARTSTVSDLKVPGQYPITNNT
ncbi:phosphatidylinositol 4,5-bisphosphate-binding protein [Ophidiomyces ophidiicola]|uniref:phosphatidylinositol 4,5-bisphosphate-binding protein n=1 Tax=Ophidiomyces ophidiicola TaxID=1387563 RepID=UPI0020C2235E|nr:phosphatidylinositol 4,5-bisphosphate-binding protein [Ophidiomyces ophidiicola]KAI1942178.1 phosphatidylinositol 4,5-bisphosphate-binding protein [Ophidiomyces ophidiicola]KAI2062281.1 phosphatidylinositol 4,5-bisphosphate-binding protein [Ophidiomyces ophidiicola]